MDSRKVFTSLAELCLSVRCLSRRVSSGSICGCDTKIAGRRKCQDDGWSSGCWKAHFRFRLPWITVITKHSSERTR